MASGSKVVEETDSGDIFLVEKVVDIKWIEDDTGREVEYYRVRWKNYNPADDTWEPRANFLHESINVVHRFNDKFRKLQKEYTAMCHQTGKRVVKSNLRKVNILSEEIENILKKKTTKIKGNTCTSYFVKWVGFKQPSWESEFKLIHASDKVESFLHKGHVQNSRQQSECAGAGTSASSVPDPESHQKKQKANQDVEEDKSTMMRTDPCSRVRSRRANTENKLPIVDSLPKYDASRMEVEFKKQINLSLKLSKEEFCTAVNNDDYGRVMACLSSGDLPDVDFQLLFLAAARRGQRDIALLLATCVPDLSVQDEWGETALTMAARRGDIWFAYHLLVLGVPVHEQNNEKQSARDVAAKYHQKHFLVFWEMYKQKGDPYLQIKYGDK